VAVGSGATPAHGGTDGAHLGWAALALWCTKLEGGRGKGQYREGMTQNSPRQSVLSGKWRFRQAVTAFPFASSRPVWVLLQGPPTAMESETGSPSSGGAHRLEKQARKAAERRSDT
jgi:hypothetical protein